VRLGAICRGASSRVDVGTAAIIDLDLEARNGGGGLLNGTDGLRWVLSRVAEGLDDTLIEKLVRVAEEHWEQEADAAHREKREFEDWESGLESPPTETKQP
jgi:hypothetical protein